MLFDMSKGFPDCVGFFRASYSHLNHYLLKSGIHVSDSVNTSAIKVSLHAGLQRIYLHAMRGTMADKSYLLTESQPSQKMVERSGALTFTSAFRAFIGHKSEVAGPSFASVVVKSFCFDSYDAFSELWISYLQRDFVKSVLHLLIEEQNYVLEEFRALFKTVANISVQS